MRNTGILLFLIGLYVVINSGSFRDLMFGKAKIGFLSPAKRNNVNDNDSDNTKAVRPGGGNVAQ